MKTEEAVRARENAKRGEMIHSFECPRASPDLAELFTALAVAQGAFENPAKDQKAGDPKKFTYQYADLKACWDVVRKPLAENGLSVSQWLDVFPDAPGEYIEVLVTLLAHSSGQWRAGVTRIEVEKESRMSDLQAFGSAITYLRRYALMAVLGIAPEDDDGLAAIAAPRAAPKRRRRRSAAATLAESGPPDFIDTATTTSPKSAETPAAAPRANDEEVAEAMAKPMLLKQRENIFELALGRGMSLERLDKLIQEKGWCDEGLEGLTVEKASEFYNYLASNTDVR